MQTHPVEAITFDLDDTLWPIRPVIESAERVLHQWLETHRPEVAERFHVEAMRELRESQIHRLPHLANDFSALRMAALKHAMVNCGYSEACASHAFEAFFEARHEVTLFPEVLEVLELLSARFPLAAVSNGNAVVNRVGLGHVISLQVSARGEGSVKPDRAIFAAACERLGVPMGSVVHVGDHPEQDVMGARNAGMQAVWINRGGAAWPLPDEPEPVTIRSLEELPGLLVL